jgi:hypothetical protein
MIAAVGATLSPGAGLRRSIPVTARDPLAEAGRTQ